MTFEIKGQSQYYKFPIVENGVYQIDNQLAQSLGFESIDAIGIFGHPGKLPQKLDSINLELNQVPTQIRDNKLYFFLEGPHTTYFDEGEFMLNYNHYADTLYYLIGPKIHNKFISEPEAIVNSTEVDKVLEVQAFKWYEANMLNSGRDWYSAQIGNGISRSINFTIKNTPAAEAELTVKAINSSLSTASFQFQFAGEEVGSLSLPSFPNTTYGVKGREATFNNVVHTKAGESQFTATFQTNDLNGSGHLDHVLLSVPVFTDKLKAGVYFASELGVLAAKNDLACWLVTDFYNVKVLDKNPVKPGDKLVAFNPSSTPSLNGILPVNINLREPKKASLFIITTSQFSAQANRLAQHKNSMGISTEVIDLSDIYNSFSYGTPDVVGIRNFLAYHYHKTAQLNNVLFLGKGTFDYKNKLGGRPNIVPTYSSRNSLNP